MLTAATVHRVRIIFQRQSKLDYHHYASFRDNTGPGFAWYAILASIRLESGFAAFQKNFSKFIYSVQLKISSDFCKAPMFNSLVSAIQTTYNK